MCSTRRHGQIRGKLDAVKAIVAVRLEKERGMQKRKAVLQATVCPTPPLRLGICVLLAISLLPRFPAICQEQPTAPWGVLGSGSRGTSHSKPFDASQRLDSTGRSRI